MWNGRDPILKERLFGLSGPEGNHGEDVKEIYFYEKSTPTHSYMTARYIYPVLGYPYDDLVEENTRRTREEREYEVRLPSIGMQCISGLTKSCCESFLIKKWRKLIIPQICSLFASSIDISDRKSRLNSSH